MSNNNVNVNEEAERRIVDPEAPFDTAQHLRNARKQADARGYDEFTIVDADMHHYEDESWADLVAYIDDEDGQFNVAVQALDGGPVRRLTSFVESAVRRVMWDRSGTSLLFQADLQMIEGAYQSLGFFRDRDQASFRVTYQLN